MSIEWNERGKCLSISSIFVSTLILWSINTKGEEKALNISRYIVFTTQVYLIPCQKIVGLILLLFRLRNMQIYVDWMAGELCYMFICCGWWHHGTELWKQQQKVWQVNINATQKQLTNRKFLYRIFFQPTLLDVVLCWCSTTVLPCLIYWSMQVFYINKGNCYRNMSGKILFPRCWHWFSFFPFVAVACATFTALPYLEIYANTR